MGPHRSHRLLFVAVYGYAAAVVTLWVVTARFADRAWLVTLVAFGPRWLAALPILPLTIALFRARPLRRATHPALVLLATIAILVVGFLDFSLGIRRAPASAAPEIRLLTHNLGFSRVTAASLDALLRAERVDLAALQECPFYRNEPARFGWHFFYGGDLCIVSRFPFTVLDVSDPSNVWRRHDRTPLRIDILAPAGHFQLLNVHLETIRGGLRALGRDHWRGLPRFEANRAVAWRDSRAARARTHASSGPLLIAGDFNLPAESAIYRDNWSAFTNAFSACGRGFGYTKFTRVFGIRIDHVLMSDGWECVDAQVLDSPYGGDHAPLLVRLHRTDDGSGPQTQSTNLPGLKPQPTTMPGLKSQPTTMPGLKPRPTNDRGTNDRGTTP